MAYQIGISAEGEQLRLKPEIRKPNPQLAIGNWQ